MTAPLKGIKMRVFGAMLVCLGAITAWLSRMIGFELDGFYVAISFAGAGLFAYGTLQKNQHKTARFLKEDR